MTLLQSLAAVLSYPADDYQAAVADAVSHSTIESSLPLQLFAEWARTKSTVELQEVYIQSFDLNPVCALEIGWHLFGENYDRGILLVRMRALLDRYGIRETKELPDHLTHALLLLDRMTEEDALDFAAACVVPAMQKMRDAINGKNIPYEPVIDAILCLLYARFPQIPLPKPSTRHESLLPRASGGEGGRRPDGGVGPAGDSSPSSRLGMTEMRLAPRIAVATNDEVPA